MTRSHQGYGQDFTCVWNEAQWFQQKIPFHDAWEKMEEAQMEDEEEEER